MYTNANSLGNKHDELRCRVKEHKPDVIGLTEVWQKETFVLDGYHPPFRKDRPDGQIGGGAMLFVKESFPVLECIQLNKLQYDDSI